MQHDIDERGPGVFAPDTLLPTQYFDRIRRRNLAGEQRLMIAVIEDAVDHLNTRLHFRHHQELAEPSWIGSEDRSAHSFETICDYPG
jgi:hypothetical protein